MKKITLLIITLLAVTAVALAQNQTINGNLHVSNTSGGNLRIGKIGDAGNKAVPIGGLAAQYNLDFSGYRDVAADQIGARISALRFNQHLANSALVQKTGLAFYTNPLGMNTGTTDLVERMRITPEGNIGIGITNPTGILHLYSSSPVLAMTYPGGGYAAIRSNNNVWTMGISGNPGVEDVSLGTQSGEGQRTLTLAAGGTARLKILANGNVGIGTINPTSKLEVAGTIRAKEVKIEATGWSDFVFDKSYNLPKLSDVEKHINDKQHLPGIPSEKQMVEEGLNVNEMQIKLLQKIEELTLYMIEQDKKIEKQDKQNKDLQKQVNELKAQLNDNQP